MEYRAHSPTTDTLEPTLTNRISSYELD
jgi:hypothetical protein